MYLLFDSRYFYSSWKGEFYCENGEWVADVQYAESAGKGVLTISGAEATFEVHSVIESFSGPSVNRGGGGRMLYNGKPAYNFTAKTPVLLEVRTADLRGARPVFRTQVDSWNRRFCWAYRQGLSLFKAWQYASWGNILIGRKCCFCSLFPMNCAPRQISRLRHPLFHESDEGVWLRLGDKEKLLVLALSVRGLCGLYNGREATPLSSMFSSHCPDVPSFIINEKGNCDINPARFYRRIIGEFLVMGHPVTWLVIIGCWALYAAHPEREEMAYLLMAIIFTVLGFGWILICRWANNAMDSLEW